MKKNNGLKHGKFKVSCPEMGRSNVCCHWSVHCELALVQRVHLNAQKSIIKLQINDDVAVADLGFGQGRNIFFRDFADRVQ